MQTRSLMMTSLKLFIGLNILAVISIFFIDKPLALYVHKHGFDTYLKLRLITEGLPVSITVLGILLLLYKHYKNSLPYSIIMGAYFYLTLRITLDVKVFLKMFFGRYWPKTWIDNNLSLIHDGIYGFNWFNGFGNQGCFPSGHSTYVIFCCTWLIYFYPKLKPIWYLILAVMVSSLITLDYHFLGDCFAGIALGTICAAFSILLWEKYVIKRFLKKALKN